MKKLSKYLETLHFEVNKELQSEHRPLNMLGLILAAIMMLFAP